MSSLRLATASMLSALLAACAANVVAPAEWPRSTVDREKQVLAALGEYAGDESFNPKLAFADLDADGDPEAVALLVGDAWCGTGGCTLVVLRRDGASWKVVSHASTSRPPVVALESITRGWRDLAVTIVGGGELIPRQMVLEFGERGYTKQPGVVAGQSQEVLIPSP